MVKMFRYMFSYRKYAVFKQKGPVVFSLLVLFLFLFIFESFGQTATDTAAKSKPPQQRPAARAPAPDKLPGKGLAQHDFLYAGGWDTRKDTQTIFRVAGGKVVWTWSI